VTISHFMRIHLGRRQISFNGVKILSSSLSSPLSTGQAGK